MCMYVCIVCVFITCECLHELYESVIWFGRIIMIYNIYTVMVLGGRSHNLINQGIHYKFIVTAHFT